MDDGPRNSGGKMSLMEIQAEQERDRRGSSDRGHRGNSSGGGGGHRGPYASSSGGGGGGGGRRGNNNQSRRGSDRSSLPLERGCICSLKDKFGFIHCADRPAEIFFHYSEVANVHPDHLQLDDEVEFRVGRSRDNPDKLAALEVTQLPRGSVEWEYEESPGVRFQGLVDRPLSRSGGNNSNNGLIRRNSDRENDNNNSNQAVEGVIRMLVPTSKDDGDKKQDQSPNEGGDGNQEEENGKAENTEATVDSMSAVDGPKIRFTPNDFNPELNDDGTDGTSSSRKLSSSSNIAPRLYRGDLVEFTLVVEKRTRQKFARKIVLLQSERERSRVAREEQMMANATLERGVVVSLKQEFGFLRSNARREEVYFHYSHVQLDHDGGDDDDKNADLQVGQEMEFLVVAEEIEERSSNNNNNGGGGGRKQRTSARMVKFLPKGSVQFEKVIAEGVTGIVDIVPRADASRDPRREPAAQSLGTIRLPTPIKTMDPASKDAEPVEVKKVLLNAADSPGGIFTCARGSSMGLWIRHGDTLLFDIMYDFVDRSYYAKPTKHLVPVGSDLAAKLAENNAAGTVDGKENTTANNGADTVDVKEGSDKEPAINDAPPDTNASNNSQNNGNQMAKGKKNNNGSTGAAVRLIRLCLAGRAEGIVHTTKEAYGFVHFAERPVDVHFKLFELLPDEVQEDIRRNMGLAMTLNTKADMMGFYRLSAGTEVQFDMSVQGTVMTQNQHQHRGKSRGTSNNQHERENLKAQRILILPKGTILQSWTVGLGMRGVITKEDPNQPYAGTLDLEEECQQMSLEQRHPLVATMVDELLQDEECVSLVFHDVQSLKEEDVIAEMIEFKANGKLELTYLPHAGEGQGRICIRKVDMALPGDTPVETEANEENGELNQETKKQEFTPEDQARSKSPKAGRSKSPKGRVSKKKKALQQKLQPIKTNLRYDKSSLAQAAKTDVPPGAGDVIVCDVHQNRRTGKTHLENLNVLERKVMDAAEAASVDGTSGVGVVKEVVMASKFGFISVSDETAAKRELLFFHFDNVTGGRRSNQNAQYGKNKKSNAGSADAIIHKGDEVKFKIGTEKNGKRVAVDVQVISSGVIPDVVDKNACRGYILVEPTDTKVGSTPKPSRSFTRSRDAAQPLQSGGRWDHVKEDHQDKHTSKGEGVILLLEDPSGMFASAMQRFSGENSPRDGAAVDENQSECHLHYQNGALALHGAGAPTSMDSSTHPRRGDLVSFVKSKNSVNGVRDIRVVARAAATLITGRLEGIDHIKRTARFVGTGAGTKTEYTVSLREVVSCDPLQLKNGVEVEGILRGDTIHGVCRTTDLRLESKMGTGNKERPKLNLTVKKDRAGKIMAQSNMARGPDGTTGFPAGWTQRVSPYH